MKIKISFAPTQAELAAEVVHKLSAEYPSLCIKKKPARAETNGITYGIYYLDDGRKW